jgi:hypothetical protein
VEQLKYFVTNLTYKNSIYEEIKSRINSGYILSSNMLSKNTKTEIYRTVIFPVVSYECETWSLISRKNHRLRVFEKRLLRRIFGPNVRDNRRVEKTT